MWYHDAPPPTPWSFWLFTPEGRRTYLVFSAGALHVADVTEPRTPVIAFHEDFGDGGQRPYERIPDHLVGQKMLDLGGKYYFQDARPWTEPVSLTRDADGDLVLEIRYTHNDFHGTLVKKGGQWQLISVQDAPPASRTDPGEDEEQVLPEGTAEDAPARGPDAEGQPPVASENARAEGVAATEQDTEAPVPCGGPGGGGLRLACDHRVHCGRAAQRHLL
jgi:hypothetical protein